MTETPNTTSTTTPSHEYHAEAHVLSGELQRPIEQKIERQAPAKLIGRRGGHFTRSLQESSIEGLVSFAKGETRVSGSRSLKNNGWVTLSTSILERLNLFEVITIDRLVSQVSTDHAYKDGHIPHVTFLGTQFTNFRVSGFPVELTLDLGICGDIPAGGQTYLQDRAFLARAAAQTQAIANATGLPKEIKDDYDKKLAHINGLMRTSDSVDTSARAPITCSLIQSIGPIPIPGVQIFGHILVIPEFGSVALGEVEVGEKLYEGETRPSPYFEVTGIKSKMGCLAEGTTNAGTATANGAHKP
jgi:hypothetical protein